MLSVFFFFRFLTRRLVYNSNSSYWTIARLFFKFLKSFHVHISFVLYNVWGRPAVFFSSNIIPLLIYYIVQVFFASRGISNHFSTNCIMHWSHLWVFFSHDYSKYFFVCVLLYYFLHTPPAAPHLKGFFFSHPWTTREQHVFYFDT